MIDLTKYGFSLEVEKEKAVGIPARITAVHKERYVLMCAYGEIYGMLKASKYYNNSNMDFPTVGDFVLINYNSMGDSQIIESFPRKTFFSRREPGPIPKDQAVAANFDYVFIMQSFNHDINTKRLDRYLTLGWQSGAIPVVILTKSDLLEDYSENLRNIKQHCLGVEVYAVSAKTGYGIEDLEKYLQPSTTIVFLGSSGVGKSSLVNALAGDEIMAVNDIREDDSKGRHTTTHRQLLMLKSGVMIIDTPGMRELGMWDVSSGLGEAFSDVEQYFGKCKFTDCKHISEPGCAIKDAISMGVLSKERFHSYQKLRREARFADNKSAALREKSARNKSIAIYSKKIKKNGGKNK